MAKFPMDDGIRGKFTMGTIVRVRKGNREGETGEIMGSQRKGKYQTEYEVKFQYGITDWYDEELLEQASSDLS